VTDVDALTQSTRAADVPDIESLIQRGPSSLSDARAALRQFLFMQASEEETSFGGLGLLLVFPTTVPNNSLPILHSYAGSGSRLGWKPLFRRVVN
jgi:hypothetical protein